MEKGMGCHTILCPSLFWNTIDEKLNTQNKMSVPGTFVTQPPQHRLEDTLGKRPRRLSEEESPRGFSSSSSSSAQIQVPELGEWDPKGLPDHFFVVCEGKRRTGKSTFAKWLLQYYMDKFSLVWCMTNTKASGYWQEFVGEAFTFDSWYPSAVVRLIERNDKIIKQYGEESEASKKLGSALIILDDVISSKLHDDAVFMRLAVEGRHHLISVILMTQDPKAIGPKVRDNCDVAVIFNQKTLRNKETMWADFLNDIPKKLGFEMVTHYAVEHDALIAVQTNLNSEIKRNFFKSTGDKTKLTDPNYALGGPEQRQIISKERAERKVRNRRRKEDAKFAKEDPQDIQKMTEKSVLGLHQ
jgi:hypothetical protein